MAAENCCQTARRSASARSPRRVNEYTRRRRPDSAVTQRLTSRPDDAARGKSFPAGGGTPGRSCV
jgi:hypothetical protein